MCDLISRQAAIEAFYLQSDDDGWWVGTAQDMEKLLEGLPSAQPESAFVSWLLDEIWDDDLWEINYRAFPELACRKLLKLGYIREKDGEYERLN